MSEESESAEPIADGPRSEIEHGLLLEVSQAVTSTLDLAEVVQIIANGTARLLGVETTAVYLIEDGQLFLAATTPPLDPSMPDSLRWARREDHPHIDEALRSTRAVVLADTGGAPLSPAERAVVEIRQLKSLVYLPLSHGGTPVGVLILGTVSRQRTFEARELSLCQTLTNQLAVWVQNARLHTRLKTYARELEERIEQEARLSEQLRQAQKMEAIGRLAGGVAHDFNNLLQVIHGYTELAQRGVGPSSKAHRSLRLVLEATGRARALVKQLLAFGRQQPLTMRLVDVGQIVSDLLPMLSPILGEDIAVEVCHSVGPHAARADANQLEQVLLNLCSNARDAMPGGGSLTIAVDNVRVDPERCSQMGLPAPGEYVLVSVTDTGRGMDPETSRKALEPFFTTKGLGEGSGLGLSTAHGIVTQHGGVIHIVTESQRGTTIEVYLPAAASATVADAASGEGGPEPGGTQTILLAEDHEMVRRLTCTLLESVGYCVLPAADGAEAMRIVDDRASEIDLALLDLVMPKAGADAVLRHLRERRADVPVVFVTGYAANSMLLDLARQEGIDVIRKPYDRSELLTAIRRALDARPR